LTVTTEPSSTAQSGVAFAQQPVIQLRDASGNPVSQSEVSVTAAIATRSEERRVGKDGRTRGTGVATMTNLAITGTAGDRTLIFPAEGVIGVNHVTGVHTSGPPIQLTVTTEPSSTAQSGVAFAQQPVIQLRDASGNPVSQSEVSVTAAIATGGGTLGGTLSATTNGSGGATFTTLEITGPA